MKPIPQISDEIKQRMEWRTKKSKTFHDCLEWNRRNEKYDRIRIGNDVFSVVRINYFLATGKQYLTGHLRKICGNPFCVKGEHLEPVASFGVADSIKDSEPPSVVKVVSLVEGARVSVGQTWTENVVSQLRFSKLWPPSRLVRFTKRKVVENESQ